ncbi:hypothetical protein [Enterococcus plantarum]|nr:hypothetical protein [Enterococcus plantarum]MBO0423582.1 hypothetical protein [Enterococcus plantarum]
MYTKKDKKLMLELIEKMDKQDYLAGKMEERNIHKFMVRIFKKIMKDE